MKCNGCGGEFEQPAGLFCYGNVEEAKMGQDPSAKSDDESSDEVSDLDAPQVRRENINASDYAKTLCPRCQHVLKDILLSSDLSDHWDSYQWTLMGEEYREEYDG